MGGSASYRWGRKIANARANGATDEEIAALERQRQDAIQQEKSRKETPKSLKKFTGYVEQANEWYGEADEATRKLIDEAMEVFRGIVNENEFRIRVSESVLPLIFESGDIKSQIETGTSNGMNDIDERKRISKVMFQHDGDLADDEYEKYGYLDNGTHEDMAWWYGDLDIVLKKDNLMNRTTFTLGDSLDYLTETPSFINNPLFTASGINQAKNEARAEWFLEHMNSLKTDGRYLDDDDGYAELQYHGKVTVKDIEYISLPSDWENNPVHKPIVDLITDNGFKIKYNNHNHTRQDALGIRPYRGDKKIVRRTP